MTGTFLNLKLAIHMGATRAYKNIFREVCEERKKLLVWQTTNLEKSPVISIICSGCILETGKC